MKFTEKQILAIAQKVMKDINKEYYNENSIQKMTFHKDDEVTQEDKIRIVDTWVISINSLFNNIDFLTISDETGEPIDYQNFSAIITEIEKDKDGNYQWKR